MDEMYDLLLKNCNLMSVFVALAVCLTAYICIWWAPQMSPGPRGLPYLGYYPFLSNDNLHKELASMTTKYGDTFCFNITGQIYVNLGSLKSMREALITKSEYFNARSKNFNLFRDSITEGVAYVSGEPWKVLRRFFSQKLKDYGMGKKTQESWILDSLQRTVDVLRKSKGKDFDIFTFFTENCTHSIRQLLFGSTHVDDNDAKRLADNFRTILIFVSGMRFLLAGSFFKYVILPFMSGTAEYKKAKAKTDYILKKILHQHEADFDKDNIRDLVDCYIDEKRILKEKGDSRYKFYTDKAFVDSVLQIFGDGSVTIGLLAATVIQRLSDRPDLQRRIQSEVDDVVGRDRFPSWDEKNRMPYANAVIYETMRLNDFLPILPSLECSEETTICGCRVSKGSILLLNFYSCFRDPRVYKDPEKFDPSRFLPGEDNKPKSEVPSLFGMGKRSCLGESLTNMETFLFITTVMQNFYILPPSSKVKTSSQDWEIFVRAVPRKF